MTTTKTYWTLALRDDGDLVWRPEFGSYSKAEVLAEKAGYTNYAYLTRNARVIGSGDAQADIDAAIAALNAEG